MSQSGRSRDASTASAVHYSSPDYIRNRYTHKYFEKPMNSKWTLPAITAMDEDAKRQILANEMFRRLSRVDPKELGEHTTEAIYEYEVKLIFYGYRQEERRRII